MSNKYNILTLPRWRNWLEYVHPYIRKHYELTAFVAGGTTCVSGAVCTKLNDCEALRLRAAGEPTDISIKGTISASLVLPQPRPRPHQGQAPRRALVQDVFRSWEV